jgi:hypothetical protein
MRLLKWGLFEELSPIGTLAAGIAIGSLAMPVIGRGLRTLTSTMVKGAVFTSDRVKDASEMVMGEWSGIVAEVQAERETKRLESHNEFPATGTDLVETGPEPAGAAVTVVAEAGEEMREMADKTASAIKATATDTAALTEDVAEEARETLNEIAGGPVRKRKGKIKKE